MASGRTKEREKSAVEEVAEEFTPAATIAEILGRHGVSMVPPPEKTGAHSVHWAGRAFQLPAEPTPLGLRESAEILQRKADEEEQEISINDIVDALPWDGAQAFAQAVEDLFGWGIWQPQKMMWMKIPPTMRTIKTGYGPNDTKQVFWGEMYIPQLNATLQTGVGGKDGRVVFNIRGTITKNNRHKVDTLLALARIYANEKSIYKGKAIRMFVNSKGQLDDDREPEFIQINKHLQNELVFSDSTQAQIDTNLFAPIKYSKECREMGIPLKRGILLEGPYGTGKSMAAAATAALAVENGFTFILLDKVAGLKAVLDFANRYAPVVIFAEDIDRAVSGTERTVSIDDVLNTIDGVQGKGNEIITVLTTNHVDKINRALLRPGRLDAIISVTAPDAKAAERLMRQYSRGLIKPESPLTEAGKAIEGHIPAVIREVVERAKLAALFREGGKPTELVDNDLVVAANTMKTHLDLMKEPKPDALTPAEMMAEGLRQSLLEMVTKQGTKLTADTDWMKKGLVQIAASRHIGVDLKE